MKKKICFIAWERFSYGGISRVLSDIINGLSDDYEITIVCLKDARFLENVYDIDFSKVKIVHHELTAWQKVRRELVDRFAHKLLLLRPALGVKCYLQMRYARKYRKQLISMIGHRFDVVIGASGLNESYLLSSIADEIGGVKIGWMHTSFEGYFLQGTSERHVRFALGMGKHNLSKLDKLIVLSRTDAGKFSRFCPSVTAYNPQPFQSDTFADITAKRFIFVGALSWVKGADLLIDAFVLFAKQHPDWQLHIYGDGPLWTYIQQQITENQLEKQVFLNHSTKEVKACYLKAGALLFPSRLEGFGIVQVEAMTCGLPILAHELPITKELVEDYDCGMLYPENSAESFCTIMKQYAECTPERKKEFQQHALKRANGFRKEDILNIWRKDILRTEKK